MAQHDYVIANGTGAAVRSDLNNGLAAIVSQNSGPTEPATMYAYQWWADTTTGLLKIRNAANNAWVTVGTLASANLGLLSSGSTVTAALGSASTPGITFTGDLNTGVYSPGADQVAISTNGSQRFTVDGSGRLLVNTTTDPVVGGFASSRFSLKQSTDTGLGGSFQLEASGDTSVLYCGYNGTSFDFGTSFRSTGNNRPITFSPAGSERVRIDTSGRVGIGTTSPGEPLSVATSSPGASATLARLQNTGTTSGTEARLLLSTSTSTGSTVSSGIACVATDAVGSTALALGTGTAGSYSEKARLDSSGRLLVGTSTNSGGSIVQIQGPSSTAAASIGSLTLRSAYTPISNFTTDIIGKIDFQVADGGVCAKIEGYTNGATVGTNDYPGALLFSTTADGASSPTERMRIASAGDCAHFVSSVTAISARNAAAAGTATYNIAGLHSATSTTNGTVSFAVYTNGNVQNTNNSYGSLSDIKLKENIVDASSQWEDLKALQVRKYNFKEETGQETHTQIGLVAQEVELVSPGLVSETPDRDEDGNDLGTVTKSVNYSVLYMKAVKALQEAMERIEQLEAKVAALEAS